jgi:hypothetical protein
MLFGPISVLDALLMTSPPTSVIPFCQRITPSSSSRIPRVAYIRVGVILKEPTGRGCNALPINVWIDTMCSMYTDHPGLIPATVKDSLLCGGIPVFACLALKQSA